MKNFKIINLELFNSSFIQLRSFFYKNKVFILISGCVLFLALVSLGIVSVKAAAEKPDFHRKTVTSVKIEKGDSLWSIAERYFSDDYNDMNTYVEEIKKSNGLTSDTIHAGCYIIVPYYTD